MKIAVDFNDFYKTFEKKVYTPLERKFKKAAVHPLRDGFLKVIKKELPTLLYQWVVTEEVGKPKAGILKYMGVMKKLALWLEAKGYGMFMPLLVPVIEMTVRWLYQKTVESVFDKFGIEDALESWLGFNVDSSPTLATSGASSKPK